tara:strand:+ start:692 stop:1009 length:318 start_codon:yes stop_codon:yes gene_type:complete
MEQLEEDMAGMYNLQDELYTILYAVGDAPTSPTEDELTNMLIGVIDLHKVRYEKMWSSWDQFQKNHKLVSDNVETDRHDLGETNPYSGSGWPNDFNSAQDSEPMR